MNIEMSIVIIFNLIVQNYLTSTTD